MVPPALAKGFVESANVRSRFGPHRWKTSWSLGHALAVFLERR